MSSVSNRTFPSTRAFGMISCMRFKHRMSVDFPHPEGPMIAETECSSMSIVMSSMARLGPYHADTCSTRSFAGSLSPRNAAKSQDNAGCDADPEHHEHEDEGGPPRGLVLKGIRP